ncbi:MAG: hypothetical protein L6Q49_16760 [Anaerolineales bacterium]|nr:hypothetical protein [Anaerolineales bacterium]
MNPEHLSRIKKAELLSSVGAGVLGGGITLLLAKFLTPYAIPILLIGLISHTAGMSRKHGLEGQSQTVRLGWAEALYWSCWLALIGLLIFILVRQF